MPLQRIIVAQRRQVGIVEQEEVSTTGQHQQRR